MSALNSPDAMPMSWFSTAAGPDMSDLVGPPGSVLDVWGDGEPISTAEERSAASHGKGSGGTVVWYKRGDVHALLILGIGAWMIHRYANS